MQACMHCYWYVCPRLVLAKWEVVCAGRLDTFVHTGGHVAHFLSHDARAPHYCNAWCSLQGATRDPY